LRPILLIDNYDSFTYNLFHYVKQLNVDCVVKRNDAIDLDEIAQLNPLAIIISPGPKTPKEAGLSIDIIKRFHQSIPLLGICLGHQAIGEFFGAELIKAPLPKHGKSSEIEINSDPLWTNLPSQFSVMRYHSLILNSLSNTPLKPLAETEDGLLMALKHESLPIYGIQFHPESILTEHGLDILSNWISTLETDV